MDGVEQKVDLWASYAGRAKVHGDELARLEALPGARKVLILTDGVKENLYLSGRNLGNVQVRPFGNEHAYEILWADTVVIERAAIDAMDEAKSSEDEGGDDA